MDNQKIIKFFRYTTQGIAVASFGTLGITPTWGSVVLGLLTMCISLAFLAYEEGEK